ncbi:MAG: DUF4282 domain-containing protein [Deferribacterota bacterium]|nr:DUF4282 domain-containing protein [Deferribacterota bacterium]
MEEKGFFQSLFDFEFKELITKRVISVLYIILIIASAIFALGIIIDGFTDSFFWGLVKLVIVAPLSFLIMVVLSRVVLEIVMVLFKISDDISRLSQSEEIQSEVSESTENQFTVHENNTEETSDENDKEV